MYLELGMRDFKIEPFNRLTWERNYFDIPNRIFVWVLRINIVIRYWRNLIHQDLLRKKKKILSRIVAFRARYYKTRQLFRRLFARCQFRAGTRIRHCLKTFGCTGIEFRHIGRHKHCSCIFPDANVVSTRLFSLFLIVLVCFVCCLEDDQVLLNSR